MSYIFENCNYCITGVSIDYNTDLGYRVESIDPDLDQHSLSTCLKTMGKGYLQFLQIQISFSPAPLVTLAHIS